MGSVNGYLWLELFSVKGKVLVLDEATSALDNKTEHDVMQALDIVGRRCTTIVIAIVFQQSKSVI